MTQRSEVGREPYSVQGPIHYSGPRRDWEALLTACALWVIAVVGAGLGAAAFLASSKNAEQTQAFAEKMKQISVLVDQKNEMTGQLPAAAETLKKVERFESISADLSARETKLEQSVGGLGTTLERLAADVTEKSSSSSARLDQVEEKFSKMDLRLNKAEEDEATIEKTLAQQPPPSPAPTPFSLTPPSHSVALANYPTDMAESGTQGVEEEKAATYALSRYSVVSVGKHSAKLVGPDGTVIVSKGDTLPGGQKILKLSSRHGRPRVVTDHGVIASKATE